MRLDVGLPIEIVTAGSDSNVSVCIRLGVEAIQRNCYNETNNNNNRGHSCIYFCWEGQGCPGAWEGGRGRKGTACFRWIRFGW